MSPQLTRDLERIDAGLLPPCPLISEPMNLPVMDPAQGCHEFIAHLAAKGTRLREPQVMGIARCSPTYKASLLGDELAMLFVAQTNDLRRNAQAGLDGVVGRAVRSPF